MTGFRRWLLLALLANALLSTAALARSVYLADGGVIQAQKVWKDEGRIYVLLNRDSLISFSPEELNLGKTFPAKAQTPRKRVPERTPAAVAPTAPAKSTFPAPPTAAKAAAPAAPAASPMVKSQPAVQPTPKPQTAPQPVAQPQPAPSVPAKPAAAAPQPAVKPQTAPQPAAQPQPAPAVATPSAASPAQPAAVTPPPRPRPQPQPAPAPQTMPGAALLGTPDSMVILGIFAGILALVLLLIASIWKVYVKAGKPGWASLVPIYNVVVLLDIAGCPLWWLLPLMIPGLNIIFIILVYLRLAQKFDKGALFGLGLVFLPFICFPVLGFGSAVYEQSALDSFFDEPIEDDLPL